jgi:hypothetical protein
MKKMKIKKCPTGSWYAGVLKLQMDHIRDLGIELDTLKPTSHHTITEDEFYRIVRLGMQLGVARNTLRREIDEFYEQDMKELEAKGPIVFEVPSEGGAE